MCADPPDAYFMQLALDLAAEAAKAGEIPVGAVVVRNGQVVGSGRNACIASSDPTAHAEVVALRDAAAAIGNYRLDECTLYVTLEPCAMCSGAILHARLRRVVFAAADEKTGCAGSVLNLFAQGQLNHQTQVQGGLMADTAALGLQSFFKKRRAQQRAQATPLREDALRTPEERFGNLKPVAWRSNYVSDLPALAGLRLHYWDEGPRDAIEAVLCLHSVPGWSYLFQPEIAACLDAGMRVIAPDLLGFGRSDKPKRAAFHTIAFHVQYLVELLERLELTAVALHVSDASHPLAGPLLAHASQRLSTLCTVPAAGATATGAQQACDAPYPDTGHRAGEIAFASRSFC